MNDLPAPDSSFGTAAASDDPFAAAKASAMKAAEELKSAATAKANEFRQAAEQRAQQIREAAGERGAQFRDFADKTWDEARKDFGDVTEDVKKFTREKPLHALLTAVGVGFVLGAILRR